MRLITNIKPVITFYKSFFAASFLITLLCSLLFIEFGYRILALLHGLKLSTTAILFFYIHSYKNKEYYYYHNLGLSKIFLWSRTLSIDFALYVILLSGTSTLLMHHLTADSIRLTFGSRHILTHIHLRCQTGAVTGLLGQNGAGKSCLLRILYGTFPATNRSVKFDGSNVKNPYRDPSLIRYLPQFSFIPGTLTVQRILNDFHLEFAELARRFPEFNSSARRQIGQLSGGQHRLIEIYVMICSPSRFALLDEPFTHLMPLQIEKVKELILEYRAQKALLLTDHLYRDVISVSDQLYVLSRGATHHFDNPNRLLGDPGEIEKLGYLPSRSN